MTRDAPGTLLNIRTSLVPLVCGCRTGRIRPGIPDHLFQRSDQSAILRLQPDADSYMLRQAIAAHRPYDHAMFEQFIEHPRAVTHIGQDEVGVGRHESKSEPQELPREIFDSG